MDFNNLNVFDILIPATISSLHSYSSKLSAGKCISINDVLAVSKVVTYIPPLLKYIFTSLRISFKTSKQDLKADAWIVANFMLSNKVITSLCHYMRHLR